MGEVSLLTQLSAGVKSTVRHRYDGHSWHPECSEVVLEMPVTVMVNGLEYVTAAVTAIDLKDWVLGLLAGDGVISRAEEITIFQWRPEDGQIWVRVPGAQVGAMTSRYLGSCCGQSRPGFFNPVGVSALAATLMLKPEDMQQAFEELNIWSSHQHSGGLHVAGLAKGPQVTIARADVGRHNALDKVYGAALLDPTNFMDSYVVFSGRLSAEIIWKVRTMGIEAIVSNAAPTSLGIELGERLGVSLIGFVRDEELSVFAHPERLLLPT